MRETTKRGNRNGREREEERKKETVNKFMGKVKSIASSAVQRVAPSAFIFHFSFTTHPPSATTNYYSLPTPSF